VIYTITHRHSTWPVYIQASVGRVMPDLFNGSWAVPAASFPSSARSGTAVNHPVHPPFPARKKKGVSSLANGPSPTPHPCLKGYAEPYTAPQRAVYRIWPHLRAGMAWPVYIRTSVGRVMPDLCRSCLVPEYLWGLVGIIPTKPW
jgi:hypothetical protein